MTVQLKYLLASLHIGVAYEEEDASLYPNIWLSILWQFRLKKQTMDIKS